MFIRLLAAAASAVLLFAVSGCTASGNLFEDIAATAAAPAAHSTEDRECMARAMFFESRRSSREGLIAVGSVVMNRVESSEFPDTVCEVVAQKKQFAPGVMTRKLESRALPDVMAAADAVLAGERHPKVENARFFHQAGLNFPYKNMHYVLEAGGNVFYEKRGRAERQAKPVRAQSQLAAAGRIENKKGRTEPPVRTLAFGLEPEKADAIGALITSTATPARAE